MTASKSKKDQSVVLDVFRSIRNNQNLIPSLLGDKLLLEHKTVYDQFGQYWFSDILEVITKQRGTKSSVIE